MGVIHVSIEGRINVDVLFHDKATDAMKVVSLNDSRTYTSGKVASISGVIGEGSPNVSLDPTDYRDATGVLVSFAYITYIVAKSNSGDIVVSDGVNSVTVPSGEVASFPVSVDAVSGGILIYGDTGSAFTLILCGT